MDYLNGFRSYLLSECGLSNGTIDGYMCDVNEFMRFVMEHGLEYSGNALNLFLNLLKLKSTTLNRKRMSVRAFYKFLVSIGKLANNELFVIDSIKSSFANLPVLTDLQLQKIVGPANERDRTIMTVLNLSGMRVSELCRMNIGDVKESTTAIRIMCKGGVERFVIISAECRDAILTYVTGWRSRFADPKNNALFIKQNGDRISRRAISDMISRLSHKTGIPHSTSHTFRRSYATRAMNNGLEIEDVQSLLGHKSINATQRYLRLSTDRLRQVYRQFHPSCCGE